MEKSTKRRKTARLFLDITGVKLKLSFHSLPEDGAYGLAIKLTLVFDKDILSKHMDHLRK